MRGNLIRLAAAGVCFAALYYFGLLRFEVLASLRHHPLEIALSLLLVLATVPIAALRWHLLLRCQGFRLPYHKTLSVVFVGLFFNTFLPGSYGGDIVRAGYMYRSAPGHGGRLLFSILTDRLTGLIGLMVLALIAQIMLPSVMGHEIDLAILIFVAVLLIGALTLPSVGRLAARIRNLISAHWADRILRVIEQILTALRLYIDRWPVLLLAVAISAAQFILVLAALAVIADAFDFVTAEPINIALAGIFALVVNAIPLTPGGIGIGEAAFANALALIEPAAQGPYATVFLALRAVTLIVSLLGGLVFLVYRNEIIEYVAQGHQTEDPASP